MKLSLEVCAGCPGPVREADRPNKCFLLPVFIREGPCTLGSVRWSLLREHSCLDEELDRKTTPEPADVYVYILSNVGILPLVSRPHYASCEKLPET